MILQRVSTVFLVLERQWWCTPLILVLRRQKQVDLCEFKASLVYRVSSRTVRTVIQRNFL